MSATNLSANPAPNDPKKNTEAWLRQARELRRTFNLAKVLDEFLPLLGFLTTFAAVGILILRQYALPLNAFWGSYVLLTTLCLLYSVVKTKRQRMGNKEALIQLDVHLGTNSQLSAAFERNSEFPAYPSASFRVYRWNASRLLIGLGIPFGLLGVASFVPISQRTINSPAPTPPMSVEQLKTLAEKLEEEELLEDADIETLKERAEELLSGEPSEWYSEKNLEATDALREQTAENLDALANSLEHLEALTKEMLESPNSTAQKALEEQLNQALKQLEEGNFQPDAALAKELENLKSNGQQKMSREQLQALQGKLKSSGKALKGEKQKLQPDGSGTSNKSDGECSGSASGNSCQENSDNSKEGSGSGENGSGSEENSESGTSRGPGTAPLNLNEKSPQITSQRNEDLPASDASKLRPGDLVGLGSKKPEENGSGQGLIEPGTLGSESKGGKAVELNSFSTKDEEILRRYFK